MKKIVLGLMAALAVTGGVFAAEDAKNCEGFVSLFNGKDLTGWIGSTEGYAVENGILYSHPKKGGNLYVDKEFADFILRFEFKVPENANNGLGIRCEKGKNAAYSGMELQVLDDRGSKYTKLQPYQYHGSIYGVVPSKKQKDGSTYQKPTGEWNFQEVRAIGDHIMVILNGEVIVNAYLDDISETVDKKKHPGLHNKKGYIGWLGHGARVEWRNIRIKEVAADYKIVNATDNVNPPKGFIALFDGKGLTNWKGVTRENKFDNPLVRQKATPEEAEKIQRNADGLMRQHWIVRDHGILYFDGKKGGYSLATAKDYADFEMYVDWRLMSVRGDSGLYLRGSPQVQIWDAHNQWNIGSGGLYNNKKNPSKALKIADELVGDWNTFYIKMVGERVTVKLNGELVVDNTVLENYWDRKQPIFPKEQIELQCHGDPLEFRNIYIREL
ncbi:MAG: DUF1080 domain-containing protein [Kiritimatiellae bacterium]|nr:DUF1080 domain-containing protein [Kiritimatiellia bacterium]